MPIHTVYGVTLDTDLAFSWPVRRRSRQHGDAPVDLRFTCVERPPVAVDWDATPAVHEVRVDDADPPAITYHRLPGFDVVRIGGVADHYVWPDRIVCHLRVPAHAYLVEIQLLGCVLALWLERRGVPALHASAAVVGERAVAFLGAKGGGKTTAAAALVVAGHALLADDLLAVGPSGSGVLAQPGYPMLRLHPEQADHLLGGHDGLPLVHPGFAKRWVRVGAGFGRFHATAAPLARIYLPIPVADGGVSIVDVGSADAVLAMLRHSFLRDAPHRLGLAAARFARFAEVVGAVEVRTLRYATGYERLPDLVEAIERDLAGS